MEFAEGALAKEFMKLLRYKMNKKEKEIKKRRQCRAELFIIKT